MHKEKIIYCILKSPDKNIIGTYPGINKIPTEWINKIELGPKLSRLAYDLYVEPKEIYNSAERYPNSRTM